MIPDKDAQREIYTDTNISLNPNKQIKTLFQTNNCTVTWGIKSWQQLSSELLNFEFTLCVVYTVNIDRFRFRTGQDKLGQVAVGQDRSRQVRTGLDWSS